MSERFNPYAEWLLIDGQDRPDHYALLAVDRFESDAQRIAVAADRRIAQLRKAASKDRLALAQQLAKEILAARNCLLSADDRAAYEARLRGPVLVDAAPAPRLFLPPKAFDENDVEPDEEEVFIESDDAPLEGIPIPMGGPSPLSAVATLPEPPPVATLSAAPAAAPTVSLRQSVAPPRRSLLLPLAVGGVLLGLIGVLAVYFVPKWLVTENAVAANPKSPQEPPVVHTDFGYRPSEVRPADSPPATTPPENPATTAAPPDASPPMTEETAPAEDPMAAAPMPEAPSTTMMEAPPATAMPAADPAAATENLQVTQNNLAAVRRAMSEGDIDKAVEQMELADLEAIAAPAAEAVDRTRATLEFLRGFWRAVDEGFLGLAAGQEFEFDGRAVVVVERTPDRLVIRSSGKNRRYERKRLPPDLSLFLATRWLKPEDANTPLFLAAFHIFDGDGDPAEARRLLESARSAGTAGAAELLAELDEKK